MNHKYACVLQAAGDFLTSAFYNVPDELPLEPSTNVDLWMQCTLCPKWRKVTREYYDQNKGNKKWHCGIKGSPVQAPNGG